MAPEELNPDIFLEEKKSLNGLMPVIIRDYCSTMGGSAEDMSRFTTLVFNESEDSYSPYPEVVDQGGRNLEIVCSLPGLADSWQGLYAEAGVDTDTGRRLYLATGLASVGIVHIALDAQNATGEDLKTKLKKVSGIVERLHDKATVTKKIEELEVSGRIDASLYPFELTPEDVQLVNRLRYSMGVSYLVNDIDLDTREALEEVFATNFSTYLKKLGAGLIDFARGFGLDKHIEPDVYKQHGLSKAFHTLYFAGIFPMYFSDIIDDMNQEG